MLKRGSEHTSPNTSLHLSIHVNVMPVPSIQFIPPFFPSFSPSLHLLAHHGHLNYMDKLKVNRLLTHTHSSLARCNSPAELHLSYLRCKGNTHTHAHTHSPHWLTVTLLQSCICPACSAKVTHTLCIMCIKLWKHRAKLHLCSFVSLNMFVLFQITKVCVCVHVAY